MPIFDQGYQNWSGPLSGHGTRWLAVARHGVKAMLKSWIVRLLLLVSWLPAVALVTVLTLWGLLENQAESILQLVSRMLPPEIVAKPHDFRVAVWTIAYSYFFKAELLFSLFLVLLVGPNLVSRDLRFNALPLYLSRPLRRFDYFAGKLGVIAFFLFATMVVPAVGAYLFGLAFSRDLAVIRDTHHLLWGGILYGTLVTLSSGTLMLALSSLSRRSIYVGLAWAGLVFLTHWVSSALVAIRYDTERRAIQYDGIKQWVKDNPPPPGQDMSGPYPSWRGPIPSKAQADTKTDEEKAREAWRLRWSRQYAELQAQSEASRNAQAAADWRPLISYANNLDRLSDLLLNTDAAWALVGSAADRARPAMKTMTPAGDAVPMPPQGRTLANRRVWQHPWYWSAGVLAGVWLVSVFVLSRRVKSLDRLK